MGRIRLFPLLFQNGCSQRSRFLPQARRIVGSGDENARRRPRRLADSSPTGSPVTHAQSFFSSVILDSMNSLFTRPGSAPVWGAKKGEFRDWTSSLLAGYPEIHRMVGRGECCYQPMHYGKSEICMTVKEAALLMVGMFSTDG